MPEPAVEDVPTLEPVSKEPLALEPSLDDMPTLEPAMAAPTAPSQEFGGDIERLRVNWKQVIEQAPQDTRKTPAIAILRSAGVQPMAIEEDTVILAFRHKNHKELIEKIENQQVAEKIISSFLGHSCRISCIIEDNHLLKEALKIGKLINTEER